MQHLPVEECHAGETLNRRLRSSATVKTVALLGTLRIALCSETSEDGCSEGPWAAYAMGGPRRRWRHTCRQGPRTVSEPKSRKAAHLWVEWRLNQVHVPICRLASTPNLLVAFHSSKSAGVGRERRSHNDVTIVLKRASASRPTRARRAGTIMSDRDRTDDITPRRSRT
jgi:hypothetical protein